MENISRFLTNPNEETMEEVNNLISPTLGKALLGKAEGAFAVQDKISISLPQIYDCRVGDIWVTLGNQDALRSPKKFEMLKWMTLVVALRRSTMDEIEEPFSEFRKRVGQGLMEGAHIAIDVEIDADVRYQIIRPTTTTTTTVTNNQHSVEKNKRCDNEDNIDNIGQGSTKSSDEVILFDEGRRTLLIRFESPYFVPASAMVTGRDEYTGEPINDWSFRIADIDQLVEKQQLDNEYNHDDDDDE